MITAEAASAAAARMPIPRGKRPATECDITCPSREQGCDRVMMHDANLACDLAHPGVRFTPGWDERHRSRQERLRRLLEPSGRAQASPGARRLDAHHLAGRQQCLRA